MSVYDVFISHKSQDKEQLTKIENFLNQKEYFDYIAKLFEKLGLMSYEDGFNYLENKKCDYLLMNTADNDIICFNKYIVKK